MNRNEPPGLIMAAVMMTAIVIAFGLYLVVNLWVIAWAFLCTPGAGILVAVIPGIISLLMGWAFIYEPLRWWK
ncbi:MAG: hypothetical protein EBR79_01790 [Proteobacteria bacterium]|nr:hypothetical protein [Pseudomonadota bacterium]NBX86157.1 hypothetical protein [Pseudomonadota bacterium]